MIIFLTLRCLSRRLNSLLIQQKAQVRDLDVKEHREREGEGEKLNKSLPLRV